ncbi:MAG TPA: hypothetical protein PK916_07180 [Bacteroidota bacterium]|nr:hypothetical protein [Bacteroidota bacterium]
MTWRAILLFPVTFFPILALTSCSTQESYPVTWKGITFSTPFEFSPPVDIGLDAVGFLTPKDATLPNATMELRMVHITREMLESFGGSKDEALNYVRITFFGTAEVGSPLASRNMLGTDVAGTTQTVTIPRHGVLELYLLPLSKEAHVVLGLFCYDTKSQQLAQETMDMIAETLHEGSPE